MNPINIIIPGQTLNSVGETGKNPQATKSLGSMGKTSGDPHHNNTQECEEEPASNNCLFVAKYVQFINYNFSPSPPKL